MPRRKDVPPSTKASRQARVPGERSLRPRQPRATHSAAFYGTVRRVSARFSVTVKTDPKTTVAIAAIG